MRKKTFFKILYIFYILLLIGFIFSNSLKNSNSSSLQSSAVREWLNNIIKGLGFNFEINHFLVRKLAHFTEFFILGSSLYFGLILFNKNTPKNTVYCSFTSCIIALMDETIQYFTKRGSSVTDVWLDFTSALLAIVIFSAIYKSKKKSKKKQLK